jgi:hypothetical protein
MKTQIVNYTQPDKATAPLRQLGTFKADGYRTRVVCKDESFNLFGLSAADSQSQADRIDQLLTEHAALEAVADGIEKLKHNAKRGRVAADDAAIIMDSEIDSLLAQLAAVRGGK